VKVFLDTNVLVSAFAARGLCADLLRDVLARHDLVTGDADILAAGPALPIRALTPREAWKALREEGQTPT
jgi:hypothetical protein